MYELAWKADHIVNFNNLPIIIPHHSQVKHWYHTILHPVSETPFEKPNKISEVKIQYSIRRNCLTIGITWAIV